MTKTITKTKNTKKSNKATSKGHVHVGFLLDESGSMERRKAAAVEGYNDYIKQLENPKNVRVTLGTFDARDEEIIRYRRTKEKIKDFKPLSMEEYDPYDMTPLYDATIQMIEKMDDFVRKDDRAILVIMTDGLENASKEGSDLKAKKMIEKREKAGWVFIYLGSNQNAWEASAGLGLNKHGSNFTTTSTDKGIRSQMKSAGAMSSLFLSSSAEEYTDTMNNYSLQTEAALDEEGVSLKDLKEIQKEAKEQSTK